MAFDLEEYSLVGSRAYAATLKAKHQPLQPMLSLEMLGYCVPMPNSQKYPSILHWFYPNQGDFIALVENLRIVLELRSLPQQMRRANILPSMMNGRLVPPTRLSDHASFWDQGYNALMGRDTAFLHNPHYHQRSNRIETLNLNFLTRVFAGLEHSIHQLV